MGQVGSRNALMVLHATQRADGGWQVAGEYVLLPTLARRYVEGERSPEIGVTTLKEGTTPILFGRPPTGELRGTWRAGAFKGTRYGPGGQERERFEFSEAFPAMDAYNAEVACEASEGRYTSQLRLTVEAGLVKAFEWRSRLEPGGHVCALANAKQQPLRGGLALVAGKCRVSLRDLGEYVKAAAEDCAEVCGSQAYLEPLLLDRRGNCRLLRAEAR
ncbi:MAG: hypothetical protein ACT4P3_01420 [Betaproteobacteria bacterium]